MVFLNLAERFTSLEDRLDQTRLLLEVICVNIYIVTNSSNVYYHHYSITLSVHGDFMFIFGGRGCKVVFIVVRLQAYAYHTELIIFPPGQVDAYSGSIIKLYLTDRITVIL